MISGLGLDVVTVGRITRVLKRWKGRFERKVFTERERAHCDRRRDPKDPSAGSRVEAYAARWAAKEAFFKAVGRRVGWREVGVRNLSSGRPLLEVTGRARRALGRRRVHLSLTHDREWAAAVVILEGRAPVDRRTPR